MEIMSLWNIHFFIVKGNMCFTYMTATKMYRKEVIHDDHFKRVFPNYVKRFNKYNQPRQKK